MGKLNPRDMSRSEGGKRQSLLKAHLKPPGDEGGWQALSRDFLVSDAVRTLSPNARKALDRIIVENIDHGRLRNGALIVTHQDFCDYGVTGEYVADAVDELIYKGLIKARRGRAGDGTAHPTIYTLTFTGTHDGLPATNEWKASTMAEARLWSEVVRKQKAEERKRSNSKKIPASGFRSATASGFRSAQG